MYYLLKGEKSDVARTHPRTSRIRESLILLVQESQEGCMRLVNVDFVIIMSRRKGR